MNRAWLLGAGLAFALVGCQGKSTNTGQVRSQISEDPAAERDLNATIGQKTTVGSTEPIQVVGVGLVYKLAGTGSSAPAGGWRTILENHLRKQGFQNVRELLDDPGHSTSLVLVSAFIPPGVRKGDPLDVQISLPDESKTTSLKGGVLLSCDLMNTDTTGNIRNAVADNAPPRPGANGILMGSVMAKASGPVVAGMVVTQASASGAAVTDSEDLAAERPTLRAGRVWDGARSHLARPYQFLLNSGDQRVTMAMQIAERLNATFQATDPATKIADAKTKEVILVNVPPAYRHNHYRFLLVARHIPLLPPSANGAYFEKLEDDLYHPETALIAAIKLEALGLDSNSKRILRQGLGHESPWVRFASAEALAYLGLNDGAVELARLAESHPALRAMCLKALASTDDGPRTDRLAELMAARDPELRFGAFLALRLADEQNAAIRGQTLNHALKVHRVAPGSGGLVHLTSDGRGEVVVFGDSVEFKGPFALPAGEDFTVSMKSNDKTATVSRIVRVRGEPEVKSLTSPPDVPSVLAAMAKLGGGHTEAVELLRRADLAQIMTADLVVDAIPRQFSVDRLVAYAKTDPMLYKANREVAKVGVLNPDATANFEVPLEPEAKPEAPTPAAPRLLSRNPGRIFGKRYVPDPEDYEPLPTVVPANATEEAKPANSREPGRIFQKKPVPSEE